jgi:hypothetical protein
MEDTRSYKALISRLCYISFIVKYYGYFHESAELFRQLNKASRKEWDDNLKSIVEVILSNEECKLTLAVTKHFNSKIAKILLRNQMHNYFFLDVAFGTAASYNAGIQFLKSIEIYSPKMFKSIHADFGSVTKQKMEEFLKLYEDKGFSSEAINIDREIFRPSYPYGFY